MAPWHMFLVHESFGKGNKHRVVSHSHIDVNVKEMRMKNTLHDLKSVFKIMISVGVCSHWLIVIQMYVRI